MNAAHSVFAYGTLQIPEVMERVTGFKYLAAPARLNGYQRLQVKNKSYPGIIEAPAHSVEGVLYKDVSAQALALLDQFEGVLYVRRLVTIEGYAQAAFVYVIKDKYKTCLEDKEWRIDEFRQQDLAIFN